MNIKKSDILKLDKSKYQIIDVRDTEEYNSAHIEDALHIPLDQLRSQAIYWSKEKIYITVCGKGGARSDQAQEILTELGLESFSLDGGTFGWLTNE
jgi:rhodanese-related sulfurtransferase